MRNKLYFVLFIFLFSIISVSAFSQTVTATITYTGAQSLGCCNVCGTDYTCIHNSGGCGTSAPCLGKTFVDPVPAGNIITAVTVTDFAVCGGSNPVSSVSSNINGVAIGGSTAVQSGCNCGGCKNQIMSANFPCPTGLPSYNYGGINTLTICPNGDYCIQRAVITFTYTPVSIAPTSATASPNPSCGGSVTLNQVGGSLGLGAVWKWYTGSCGGVLVGTGASISVTPSSTTTYFVRAEGGGCGTTTCAQVTVTVNTPSTDPASATASPSTTCGTPTTLTVAGGSLGTGASWRWCSASCGGTFEGAGSSITVTPTTTTTYFVRGEGACNNTNCVQVTVTVNPVPFAIATPASATICSGATTSIALTSFVPGTQFNWTVVQTNVSGATPNTGTTIAQTLTATGSTQGTAVYTITPSANGCTGSPITVTVAVDPIPVISVSSVNPTICAGSTLPINLISTVAGTTFSWTVVETAVTGGSNSNGTTITDQLVATGGGSGTAVYTINGTANNCPAAAITNTVTVNPDPGSTAIATPAISTICSGNTTSISLTSSVSGTIFTWTSTASGVLGASSSTGTTIADLLTTTAPVSGTATYLVSSTANGCTGTPITVTVTVNPTPVGTATPTSETFCSGDSTSIALTSTVPGASFSWTVFQNGVTGGIFGTDSAIVQTLTTTSSAPGTAIYTITPSVNFCAGNAVTVTVTVNALDDASFVYSSATYCTAGTNPTPIITGVAGGTFTATPPGLVINPSIGTITLAGSAVGNYQLTYTTPGTCSNSSTITMTIDNSSPFADFTYSGGTFCQNGVNPLPVYGTGASAGVYSATPVGLTFVHINTGEIDLLNSAPGTYIVTNNIPPSGPCSGIYDTATVVIVASDDASFVYSSATYCTTGNPQTPVVTGLSGGTFSSAPSGLTLNPTTGTITLSSSAYGVYLLSYTTNGACPNIESITMTIDTITPSATFSYVGSPFCQNALNPFPFFAQNASAGIFTANPSGLVFAHVNTGEIDLASSTPGTYVVTNTIPASGVCQPISDTYTITIGPADDATFVYTSATYCTSGPNQTPAITGLPGGVFSSIPPGLSINPVTGTINLAASIVGNYTLTYSTNGSCPNTSSIVMTISDTTPFANFNYASTNFCQNDINQYPTFGVGSSAGYFTSSPTGLVIVHVNTGEIDLGASTPGTYIVTNTIPSSGICDEVIATTTLVISPADDAAFTYPSATYCTTGNPQSPTITGLPGGTFSSVPPGLTLNPSTGTITLSTSAVGIYTLSYTTFGNCPNTSSITMTINDTISAATFSYQGSPFCQSNGNNPFPTFIQGASAGTFTASPSGLVFAHVNTGEIDLAASTPGTYVVTNTIPASGVCMFVDATYTITINGAPVVTVVPNATSFCESNIAALNIALSSSIPGTQFSWTVAQSGLTGGSPGNGATVSQTLTANSVPATAAYTISSDVGGCLGNDTTITIIIHPTVSDTTAAVITLANCGTSTGGVSGITVSAGQAPFAFQWKDSTNTVVGNGIDLSNVGPGNYTLTIIDGNNCSKVIGPFDINSTPAVLANFTMVPDSGETPLVVNFTNTSVNAVNYMWYFGTGDSSAAVNPSYTYVPLGNFIVCLIANDGNGCWDSTCANVDVFLDSKFNIPNLFTPNGDGQNDEFTLREIAIGLSKLDVEIYNRWGHKEFEWHTVNGGWDGRSTSGVPASDGTYYYVINAEGIDGKKYFEKGPFTLIRSKK